MYKIVRNKNINDARSPFTDFVIERWNSIEEAGRWLMEHIAERHHYTFTKPQDNHTVLYDDGADQIFKVGDENLYIDNKEYLICKDEEDPNSFEYKNRFKSLLKI